ncbi:hypothetical protein YC2023_007438 [Brassica napus]
MAETADSSTKDKPGGLNGEYTHLKPAVEKKDELKQSVHELESAEESVHELKPAEVRVDELSELSDTSLELNELSDTEDGAGLVAGTLLVSCIKRLSASLVSPFNPSILPFGEFISLKSD